MSLGLLGKIGPEVLAHRNEPLLDLHNLKVGLHIPLGDLVVDAHQQAKGLIITSGPLLSAP